MFTEHVQSRADRSALTREKVLAAAETSFRDRGFEASTIRQIAAEAGVSVGTVMAVGDKDALLLAVYDSWIDTVHQARAEAGVHPSTGSTAGDILMLFAPFVEYFGQHRELSQRYASIIVGGSHLTPIFHGLASSLVGEIAGLLRAAGIPEGDAGRRAQAIYLSYIGVVMIASNGALDQEAAATRLYDVIALLAPDTGELP